MSNIINFISIGDLIDLFFKFRQKGIVGLESIFHYSNIERTASKWNNAVSSSDFWIIPEVRARWNEKCTGNSMLEYEDFLAMSFLSECKELKMLSVGCGSGARERKFSKHKIFSKIDGIDIASNLIEAARKTAAELNLNQINYYNGDFVNFDLGKESYDVILFNSSLHHFERIDQLIPNKVLPLLKKNGYLIIFEYVGPNRLQWVNQQLTAVNILLKELPSSYRVRFKSQSVKNKVYRPGLLRMKIIDPSEAIDSESIMPTIHKHFKTIIEKKVGWDITHLLLKDIAHNFLREDNETKAWLSYIFKKEDEYLALTGRSDSVFGVYQKI